MQGSPGSNSVEDFQGCTHASHLYELLQSMTQNDLGKLGVNVQLRQQGRQTNNFSGVSTEDNQGITLPRGTTSGLSLAKPSIW